MRNRKRWLAATRRWSLTKRYSCQNTQSTGSTTTRKSEDFDGIAVKQFLLHQAREQVSWYRQSIDALDFVGCVACRRSLETGQSFLEHYLPAYNFRETERGTEYQRDTAFPLLPKMWTRFDDEGYLDASEAGDDEIFDLR